VNLIKKLGSIDLANPAVDEKEKEIVLAQSNEK
jgi:hypothetical protein